MIPDDPAITAVLPNFTTNFEQVSRYDGSGLGNHYRGVGPKFDDLTAFEYGVGYQLYCKATSPVTVTLKGKLPTTKFSKSLGAGWHVLPAMTLQPAPISTIFGGLAPSQVLRYDTATSSLTTATEAKAGEAYYVQLTTAATWTPPLAKDPTTRFVYDGDGGRVKQTTAAGTTRYLGDAYEVSPSGTTTKYAYAGSLRIAAKDSTGALRFYHQDHLGSSNVVTDGTGAVVELNEHTPYGALARHEGTADVRHKFTGQHQDSGTGLVLFPARAYDPTMGRFLQPDPFVQDPADPQTLNRYAYARNNPVNFVDPSGYGFFRWVARIVGAIVGAVVGFLICGPECAVTGAIWGFAIGDSIGAAVEGRPAQSTSPSLPIIAIPPFANPGPTGAGVQAAPSTAPELGRSVQTASRVALELQLQATQELMDFGLAPAAAAAYTVRATLPTLQALAQNPRIGQVLSGLKGTFFGGVSIAGGGLLAARAAMSGSIPLATIGAGLIAKGIGDTATSLSSVIQALVGPVDATTSIPPSMAALTQKALTVNASPEAQRIGTRAAQAIDLAAGLPRSGMEGFLTNASAINKALKAFKALRDAYGDLTSSVR